MPAGRLRVVDRGRCQSVPNNSPVGDNTARKVKLCSCMNEHRVELRLCACSACVFVVHIIARTWCCWVVLYLVVANTGLAKGVQRPHTGLDGLNLQAGRHAARQAGQAARAGRQAGRAGRQGGQAGRCEERTEPEIRD